MNQPPELSRRRFLRTSAMAAGAALAPRLAMGAVLPSSLRVLSSNVWYGFTKKPQRKKQWLAFMKQRAPSVVSLQELNGYTAEQLAEDARSWDHPYCVLLKESGFATGFTSDSPITDVQRMLDGYHHGLMRCQSHGIYFYVVHLHPSNWEFRLREVDLLLNDIAGLPAGAKFLLVGDFNTFSPRDKSVYDAIPTIVPFFKRLDAQTQGVNLCNGELDYRHIERVEASGLVDLVARERSAFHGTFPTKLRADEDMGPERRLDYIFAC
ncbi:MAG: endonuclease/exonuclease/phosphatase family protein, partial [Planctomycetales bacterium]|nr:endonuclease/exonuclease/phosphatase family protein [Planctomycetales bacterium]